MSPKRIQLSRKKGWRMPPGTVKVTRPGKWGNPYRVAPGACWCRIGQPCHADVLLELANRPGCEAVA